MQLTQKKKKYRPFKIYTNNFSSNINLPKYSLLNSESMGQTPRKFTIFERTFKVVYFLFVPGLQI